jgi:putative IMPACT (imprinted ancient) family translation regulator
VRSFRTLAASGEAETRVQGSRFLAVAAPVESEAAARSLLAARAERMWDATHHCSAWVLRDGTRRANDAGEPGGSAGAPILAAIEGAGLVDCCVIVTRYYGGVPLGIGGLVRAYGDAAARALAAVGTRTGTLAVRFRLRYPYALTGAVMRTLGRSAAAEIHHGYAPGGSRGAVEFAVCVGEEATFRDVLQEQTGGAVEPELLGPTILYALDAPRAQV